MENDLLAELNGALPEAATPQEAQELAAAAADRTKNPLEVHPEPKLSATKRAMAALKEKAGPGALRGYAVTVVGRYAAPSKDVNGKKISKDYSLVVNLSTLECALSTIKNKMLDKMLKMKYPDYITYLTHEITEVKPLTPDTPESNNVAYMSVEALLDFIKHRAVPIDVKNYDNGRDVRNLRAAVTDFLLNPKDFAAREEKRLASIREDAELAKLNPELAASSSSESNG